MRYIDGLMAGSGGAAVRQSADGASIGPAGGTDGALDDFQSVVRDLRHHDGDGYAIVMEHESSDRGSGLVDLVIVRLEPS